ncbi:hypothetical protein BJ170DRAFT_716609 [Xylariales sp. AK1849]|nr:hypothetical protein BJ170DRAFT_716609 [Xylariales sp. AK1849]
MEIDKDSRLWSQRAGGGVSLVDGEEAVKALLKEALANQCSSSFFVVGLVIQGSEHQKRRGSAANSRRVISFLTVSRELTGTYSSCRGSGRKEKRLRSSAYEVDCIVETASSFPNVSKDSERMACRASIHVLCPNWPELGWSRKVHAIRKELNWDSFAFTAYGFTPVLLGAMLVLDRLGRGSQPSPLEQTLCV